MIVSLPNKPDFSDLINLKKDNRENRWEKLVYPERSRRIRFCPKTEDMRIVESIPESNEVLT